MVTEKERMIEWLKRSKNQVYNLRRKPRLSKDKALLAIRENYSIIGVLIQVAEGKAYMQGIAPINDIAGSV